MMRFSDAKPGDQVELRAKGRAAAIWGDDKLDPERPVQVAVITHRWHDPVEGRDYVALGGILRGGEVGPPRIKHTIRGLAQNGWYPARRDWVEYAKALDAGEIVRLKPKAQR